MVSNEVCRVWRSDRVVVVIKVDVLRPKTITADKLLISRRPLVLGVTRQHALKAHANTLDVLDRAPTLVAQQVETYDAVGVDVRVHRDRAVGLLDEGYFWRFCTAVSLIVSGSSDVGQIHTDRVGRAELELQPVDLVFIQRVVVQNSYIEEPFIIVVGFDQVYSGRQSPVDLSKVHVSSRIGECVAPPKL